MPQLTVSALNAISADDTLVQNLGPGTLWVGPVGVASGNGLRILPGQAVRLDGVSKVGLINSGGNCDVRYFTGAVAISGVEDSV